MTLKSMLRKLRAYAANEEPPGGLRWEPWAWRASDYDIEMLSPTAFNVTVVGEVFLGEFPTLEEAQATCELHAKARGKCP